MVIHLMSNDQGFCWILRADVDRLEIAAAQEIPVCVTSPKKPGSHQKSNEPEDAKRRGQEPDPPARHTVSQSAFWLRCRVPVHVCPTFPCSAAGVKGSRRQTGRPQLQQVVQQPFAARRHGLISIGVQRVPPRRLCDQAPSLDDGPRSHTSGCSRAPRRATVSRRVGSRERLVCLRSRA